MSSLLPRTIACVVLLLAAGCGQPPASPPAAAEATHKEPSSSTAVQDEAHSHEGWWCHEHGVPEEICAQCDSELANEFQKKGDWCEEHDRPESQCFECHPELEEKFAARYRAKYGEEPPKRSS